VARLHVIAVAARLPAWAEAACADYARRMPRGYALERVAVRPGAREAERLRAALPRRARLVALDERGTDLTTRQFAALLAEPTAFAIGGAEGLDAGLKAEAWRVLRLSSLTLPHALAQVLLVEQLYRAALLRTGHPYHRD
jgi:23S rRNA (pseudouridine1915-N3)-methyltransferase